MPSVAWVVEMDACDRIAAELPNEAAKILRYGANLARRNARARLRASTRGALRGMPPLRYGRPRRRGKTGRLYRASSPGQPPAKVTGALIRAARVTRQSRLTFVFDFGTGKGAQDHVARLMEGGSARIAPRPFFEQSVREATAQTEKELEELLEIDVDARTGRVQWRHGNAGREIVAEDWDG